MAQNFGSPSSMQPLNVGNVVTAAVRLYSSHRQAYLRLALKAHLWGIFVPVYGWAKYAAISGLISRLAFGDLVNRPESISSGQSYVNPKMWSFLGVAIQVGCWLLLIYIGLVIAALFIAVVIAIALGWLLNFILGSIGTTIAGFFAVIVGVSILLLGLLWYYSRWIVAEVPLAVEENVNGKASIARSWDLTKASIWRIQGITLVGFIVTLPIIALSVSIPEILLFRLEEGSAVYSIVDLISWILSAIGGIITMPFWQALKAVLYYDLRTRREGLGLSLRDRDI